MIMRLYYLSRYYRPFMAWLSDSRDRVIHVLHSFALTRRVVVSSIASVLLLSLAVMALYEMHAFPFVRVATASAAGIPSGIVSQSAAHAAAVTGPSNKAMMHEMHIANNGLILLRGATVISNSMGTIRVAMSWGSADFTWSVETDSGTRFYASNGEPETLSDVRVDDVVTVTGILTGSGIQPTIKAQFVSE